MGSGLRIREIYLCRAESRWRCPDPPHIGRAARIESPQTSYSYMGKTAYTCDTGYWFERNVFSKVGTVLCYLILCFVCVVYGYLPNGLYSDPFWSYPSRPRNLSSVNTIMTNFVM